MAKKPTKAKAPTVEDALEAVQSAIDEARAAIVKSKTHSTRTFEGQLEIASQAIAKAQFKA